MENHPIANVFPDMAPDDYLALKKDIAQHGQREPIWTYQGLIIDGRHRYRACRELGIEPSSRIWDGQGSLVEFVFGLNFYRRHLSEGQRAMAAAKAEPFFTKEVQKEAQPKTKKGRVSYRAAEAFNVGHTAVEQAQTILREADPALVRAVDRGDAKVSHAYHMLDLPKEQQKEIAEAGPKAIRQAAEGERFRKRAGKLIDEATPTMEGLPKFSVVYADPPWTYQHPVSDSRDITNHYPTMTLEAIGALPVEKLLTEDAVLLLWSPPAKVQEASLIMNAWGFDLRSCAVWVKPSIGPGYYFRARHEILLLGTHGKPITPSPSNRPDSVFEAPRSGRHSHKPEIVYEMIERMFPDLPKIELFARQARAGWVAWGLEAPDSTKEPQGV